MDAIISGFAQLGFAGLMAASFVYFLFKVHPETINKALDKFQAELTKEREDNARNLKEERDTCAKHHQELLQHVTVGFRETHQVLREHERSLKEIEQGLELKKVLIDHRWRTGKGGSENDSGSR